MNPQENQQVAARDDKWVPFCERVKISSINIRLETTVPQKEETFQQFWYSIKKVQGCYSYEFLLANKKCTVNAKVIRIILDICSRLDGVDFTDVLDNDTALAFLIDLGYKGPLYKHKNMFVDHMHQPWRTLAAIINKCDDYQEYRLPIPYVMLTYAIKRSESYQMFIKYSTHQILPNKSRGKVSKGKKTADESQKTIDVSKESELEPAKKNTSSKRRVKKNVTLSADDNIISDYPDSALELAKSISQTEAKKAEATRKVYATHARIVTKSVLKST
uniref:Uncharacterized protein n=1 Tax=Tanacetum cinerariifolium TaxID=118510 RepID=A0A699K3Z3_TANCI|nr:hypothetical protein [Tanacetum cinerariifolium]